MAPKNPKYNSSYRYDNDALDLTLSLHKGCVKLVGIAGCLRTITPTVDNEGG